MHSSRQLAPWTVEGATILSTMEFLTTNAENPSSDDEDSAEADSTQSATNREEAIMRVITGKARGVTLKTPEGLQTRPTTDRVKEALFSVIQFDIPAAAVLDLFGGTGQLGIEALSRGAEEAVFVDSSRKSLDVVKKNIELCRFQSVSHTHLGDSVAYLRGCGKKFDIVFLDPPYHKELCVAALENLGNCVNDGAIIICETQNDEILPEETDAFIVDRVYSYSAIKLTVYHTK